MAMTDCLDRNLSALSGQLRTQLLKTRSAADLKQTVSRDGLTIIGIRHSGRDYFFHSTYSASTESKRIASTVEQDSLVVALGFGAGYHLIPLLDAGHTVVAVEPRGDLLRAGLTLTDVSEYLQTGQLLITGGSPDVAAELVRRAFVPALDERIRIVELPGRVARSQETFAPYKRAVTGLYNSYASDIATQAVLARRWMSNAVANLIALTAGRIPAGRINRVGGTWCIAAAGPSLASQINWIREYRNSLVVLSVDTAYPVLLQHGICPDLVISVDCQLASYHHFLVGRTNAPAVIDLSATGAVMRSASPVVPAASGHPFHSFLRSQRIPLTPLATGSGTVTGAAVSLATAGGAQRLVLAGIDSCYPSGELYPRGSFLHHALWTACRRTTPMEGRMQAFLWDRAGVEPIPDTPSSYSTPQLDHYHRELTTMLGSIGTEVYSLPGTGRDVGFPAPPAVHSGRARGPLVSSAGPLRRTQVISALTTYREILSSVGSKDDLRQQLREAESSERFSAIGSILPLIIALGRDTPDSSSESLVRSATELLLGWTGTALARLNALDR